MVVAVTPQQIVKLSIAASGSSWTLSANVKHSYCTHGLWQEPLSTYLIFLAGLVHPRSKYMICVWDVVLVGTSQQILHIPIGVLVWVFVVRTSQHILKHIIGFRWLVEPLSKH